MRIIFLIILLISTNCYADVTSKWSLRAPPKQLDTLGTYNYLNTLYSHFNQLEITTTDPNGSRNGSPGNEVLYYDGVNYLLKSCVSGTTWITLTSSGGSGISSLNGLTAASQTFATGTSGADFNISSVTSTHTFNLPTASAVNRGALSSADWTTFNSKGSGTITNIATSSPITGGPITSTGTIGITQSTTSTNGYLSSTDWNTFNNKVPTTRTITAGTGLTGGGDLSVDRTIALSVPVSIANGGTNNTSYTTGSVIFFDGTKLGQDNTNLFWDGTNHFIGIKTNAPEVPLDVRGQGTFYNIGSRSTVPTYPVSVSVPSNNSIAFGYSTSPSIIQASGKGSFSLGHAFCDFVTGAGCNATMVATGDGSFTGGYIHNATGATNSIKSTGNGSFLWGYLPQTAGNSLMLSSGLGSVVFGAIDAVGGGTNSIKSTGNGSFSFGNTHGYQNGFGILSSGAGSLSGGYSESPLSATNKGSIALGASTGSTSPAFVSSGIGSVAMGYATTTLQATGTASVAIGQDIQATANNAVAIGSSCTNSTASTFNVCFSSTPIIQATNTAVGIATAPIYTFHVNGSIGVTSLSGTGKVVCVKSDGSLGVCSDQPNGSGVCTCS